MILEIESNEWFVTPDGDAMISIGGEVPLDAAYLVREMKKSKIHLLSKIKVFQETLDVCRRGILIHGQKWQYDIYKRTNREIALTKESLRRLLLRINTHQNLYCIVNEGYSLN